MASEFKVELDPAKVIQPEQVFTGETELTGRSRRPRFDHLPKRALAAS